MLATRPTAASAFVRFSWVTVNSIIVITFLIFSLVVVIVGAVETG